LVEAARGGDKIALEGLKKIAGLFALKDGVFRSPLLGLSESALVPATAP
jgi:hypothetical protein